MKIKLLFLALATIVYSTSIAQSEGDTPEMKDPKAKEILDKLSAKNKTYTTISAEFDYNMKNVADGIDETQSGKLVTKGDKYKLNIVGQEIICNGKTIWTYIADNDEVQISNVSNDEEGMINPASIFTIYENGFKYKFMGEEGNLQTVNLFPEKANEKSYHTVQLIIDKTKTQITKIIIKSKDGNVYTYSLKSFKTNEAILDTFFNFDASKVGDVIDLRD